MSALAYKPKRKLCVIKIWIGLKLGSSLCCALLIAALFAIFCYIKPCIKRTWQHVLTNPCRFFSRPCDSMDTNYPLPLSEKQLRELEASAKDHAIANGKMTKYYIHMLFFLTNHIHFIIYATATPFPRHCLIQARAVQTDFNTLFHRVANDHDFLHKCFEKYCLHIVSAGRLQYAVSPRGQWPENTYIHFIK